MNEEELRKAWWERKLQKRGMCSGDEFKPCVICGRKTNTYDFSYECPVHIGCQEILDKGYFLAEMFGINSKEYQDYLKDNNLTDTFLG